MTRLRRAWAASVVLALGQAAGAQVEIRGETTPRRAVVEKATLEGVLLRPDGMTAAGIPTLIGWDRVRAVTGPMAVPASPFLPISDAAFRARVRLERGDVSAAEPLFEQLYPAFRTARGPTAALVDEGTLRCRLSRGMTASAVFPWLSWLAATRPGADEQRTEWIGGTLDAASISDQATDLVPSLSPILLPDARTAAFLGAAEWSQFASGDRVVVALASLYRASAAQTMGETLPSVSPLQPVAGEHEGVRFVTEIVRSGSADEGERRHARTLLTERMNGAWLGADVRPARAAWIEAWCRAAIGRSLLKETGIEERRRGIIELLHVPARFGDLQPRLAAVSLALAAVAMHDMGDDVAAAAIAYELRGRYPGDAAASWEALSVIAQPKDQKIAEPTASSKPVPAPAVVRPDGAPQ